MITTTKKKQRGTDQSSNYFVRLIHHSEEKFISFKSKKHKRFFRTQKKPYQKKDGKFIFTNRNIFSQYSFFCLVSSKIFPIVDGKKWKIHRACKISLTTRHRIPFLILGQKHFTVSGIQFCVIIYQLIPYSAYIYLSLDTRDFRRGC